MKKKVRIGILTENTHIPKWSYMMLERLIDSDYAELVLNVKKVSSSNTKSSLFKRISERRENLIYSLYRKIDNKLFNPKPSAFITKDINEILECPTLSVLPRETKFSDYVSKEDLESINEYKVDVFIRMGFRILRGGILNASKYGVWSYHHGDNSVNRGGPAGVWEVINGWDTTGVILQVLTEDLDGGLVLAKSISSTDKTSVKRNRNNYYWKAMSLLPRKVKELYELGEKEFFDRVNKLNSYRDIYYNRLFLAPKNGEMLSFFPKVYLHKIYNKLKSYFIFDQWILLFNLSKLNEMSTTFYRFKRLTPPNDRFWADPFIYERDNTYYIYIEELVYNDKLGKISLIEMDAKGNWLDPVTVIQKDYHLSYPYLIEVKGELFMIPETSKNSTIEMYKCTDFPLKWELHKVLMKDVVAVDATILLYDDMYWMFCNIKENEGASTKDELFLYYADEFDSSEWQNHPKNPIVSNATQSRPAGKIFEQNGKLYRPSQNSAKWYGHSMKINEIEILSTTDYKERTVQDVLPEWDKDLISTHTINHEKNLTVIDAKVKKYKW